MSPDTHDVIVVGSGAAGSFAAKELTEQGLRVLLLEAGRSIPQQELSDIARKRPTRDAQLMPRIRATLSGQHLQSRVAFFNEQMKRLFVNDWSHGYTAPKDAPYLWIRGRQVGGRLHVFGRVLFRWSDYDFKGASHQTGGVNWPISYADLVPYYEQVERFLGIHGNMDAVETAPDGVMAEPAVLTPTEKYFCQTVEEKWPERHVVAWRFTPHDGAAVPPALKAALETGRLTLQSDAIVQEITTDPETGRATGVRYINRETRQAAHIPARAVVMCASPVETLRIMLNSRSARHPDGIGNSTGQLGHYYMDQCASLMFGAFPRANATGQATELPDHPFYGKTGGFYIPRYRHTDPGNPHPYAHGYSFQGSIDRYGGPSSAQSTLISIMGFGEMLPHYDNRVSLDPKRTDRWKMPLPHIRCAVQAPERATLESQIRDCARMIEASGGTVHFWASPLGLEERGPGLYPNRNFLARMLIRHMFPKSMVMGAAIHESGGARIGTDPKVSVLNPYNQCWDAPNVVVTDASSFPSGGTLGTTLTVMAMTVRACVHLAQEYKAGRL
ncbi:GMC oxidoreductase [Komagataeibacter sp. FXV3]|uniref:GMC oxidoreductase n=1 Tax=Komagataeibacter sp. FXV3 TaxID=2608998 RepID=UPI00187B143A|nr:GMC family oxidoreductase [Komagataeibacter sp. FXV3]MBE7728301.1 GMC family oxidoreductase [Komagataeibacter sp. FXV3]